jgi:Domain of Unknown Function (DUF1080)
MPTCFPSRPSPLVRRTGAALIGLSLSLLLPVLAPAATPAPAMPLFNGQNLDGWTVHTPDPAPAAQHLFEVTEGMLHTYPNATYGTRQPMGYIATQGEYGDYRLTLEYMWGKKKFAPRADPDTGRDAGVCFHVQSPDLVWPVSVECQIQEGDTGDAWLVHTRATARVHPDTMGYWPVGQEGGVEVTKGENPQGYSRLPRHFYHEQDGWNRVELIVRGDGAEYYVNGHLVNKLTQIKKWDAASKTWVPLTKGRILLQAEGAEIFYRRVTIQPLDAPPATAP